MRIWVGNRFHPRDLLGSAELQLPYTIGGTDDVVDLFTLFDETIRLLQEHVN